MGDKSKILWTEATWNPIRGCSRVSEGCRNCYAEAMAARFWGPGQPYEGLATPVAPRDHMDRVGGRRPGWTGQVRLVAEHLQDPLRWRRARRIFVNSMSDLFHESLPFEQIDRIFGVMAAACDHTFQVLTKRAGRMAEYLREDRRAQWAAAGANGDDQVFDRIHLGPRALPNVWLGVTVENQDTANERIPHLLLAPAAVRWISAEPLLGPVLLDNGETSWLTCTGAEGREAGQDCCEAFSVFGHHFRGIDWVVCGGESGPKARPMHPDWARGLRDQCTAAGVPFLFKQWGEWAPFRPGDPHWSQDRPMYLPDWPRDEQIRLVRVGKKAAGRLLDGVLHDGYPEVARG